MSEQPVSRVRDLMVRALERRGITGPDSAFLVDDDLEAQLEGKRITHGLGRFLLIDAALAERRRAPEVVRDRGARVVIDGHRQLGHLAGRQACALAVDRAAAHGVAVVSLVNVSRAGRLAPFARLIAEGGCVAIGRHPVEAGNSSGVGER